MKFTIWEKSIINNIFDFIPSGPIGQVSTLLNIQKAVTVSKKEEKVIKQLNDISLRIQKEGAISQTGVNIMNKISQTVKEIRMDLTVSEEAGSILGEVMSRLKAELVGEEEVQPVSDKELDNIVTKLSKKSEVDVKVKDLKVFWNNAKRPDLGISLPFKGLKGRVAQMSQDLEAKMENLADS